MSINKHKESGIIAIGDRSIGAGHLPFVIAEMSGNHNQSLERALEIVAAAAKTGAHALKIQTYTAATMTLDLDDGDFFIDFINKRIRHGSGTNPFSIVAVNWE
jgi:sialic acid synthase SpsE